MTYIHDRNDWPSFRYDATRLASLIATDWQKIGVLIGKARSFGLDVENHAALEQYTNEVVATSAIEGERFAASDVRSSVALRLGLDVGGVAKADRHRDGIVDVTLDAVRNCNEPLSSERLHGWHALLFPTGWSGATRIEVGRFRAPGSGPMQVVSSKRGRTTTVHFEAPTPERLDLEMTRFLEWFESKPTEDLLVRSAIAHFWFVTLHPYDDGNGRLARAIADLALARADGHPSRLYSLSTQIAAERDDYYEILETSQRGDLDITPWLEWSLSCLGRTLDAAETTFDLAVSKAEHRERFADPTLNGRQRKVLTRLLDDFEGDLTTSKYAKIARCSQDTALRDIQDLLSRRLLARNKSAGRSTSYRVK